jgi:predicted amidophosphoribosyltransferase
MINLIFMGLWRAAIKHDRAKCEKTIVICAKCSTEHQKGTKFCSKCGNNSFLRPSEKYKIEVAQREHELEEIKIKQRLNAAITRIHSLSLENLCYSCTSHFEPSVQFCTNCGAAVSGQPMPDDWIYSIAQPEFPDLIQNYEQYLTLKNSKPESGLGGKEFGILVTKFLDKNSIWHH